MIGRNVWTVSSNIGARRRAITFGLKEFKDGGRVGVNVVVA
jgi:hypothetical protein